MNALLILLAILIQDVPAPPPDTLDHAALDAVVAEYEGEDKPGFTAALCRDGKVIWTNSCGEASLEWGVPNSRDTVFRLASTSKQFTAAAICMLALDGKLELDAPMSKYLPEFSDLVSMPSVRQMMHHTSGLRDYLSLMSLMDYEFEDKIPFDELLDVLVRQEGLNFEPGTDWSYSNSNYVLMALIVERVSSEGLAEFTQKRIFDPLDMTDTLWLDDAERVIERRAWGYIPYDEGYERSETRVEFLGDGALASTVVDLAKWAAVLIDPPQEWKALIEAMLDGVPIRGDATDRYGAGLSIDSYRGLPRVHHGGAFVGFRCQMAHLPEQNLTAICLANNGEFNPDSITNGLFEAALGDTLPEGEKAASEPAEEETKEARKARLALRKAKRRKPTDAEAASFVGQFECPELLMEFAIELDDKGRLRVRMADGRALRMQLRRENGEAITHGFTVGVRIDFEFDAEGRMIGGTIDAGRAKGMRLERRAD